jgi:hypothetical protein
MNPIEMKSEEVLETAEDPRLLLRPDGYYVQAGDGARELGPFATAADALEASSTAGDEGIEAGETLEEAEDEMGISGWVDPETHELAEESVPRIEEH